nr:SLC13 family permease [Candidatus Sigynarchaeota archaeon]
MLATIIILAAFAIVIALIASDKMNKAVASLSGAVVTFFALVFIKGVSVDSLSNFIFGSAVDGFVNLHSLILIIGMMLLIDVCQQAGMFQFLAINIVKITGTSSPKLMATLCALSMVVASVMNNLMAIIVLLPLTIMIARILDLNPAPYIITQAIIVNMGTTFFSISSVPNIIIATSADISFASFFINVGIVSIIIGVITILFFLALYKNDLGNPSKNVEVLREFNVWTFIPNKTLLYKSFTVLIAVMACFVIIPPDLLSLDMIALTGALVLVIISKLKVADILAKLDVELILYLVGIFFITGALETLGLLDLIGNALVGISGDSALISCLLILWLTAYVSANLDNISITKIMIPAVEIMAGGIPAGQQLSVYYTLAFGAGWGDNLSPLGDNIIVINLSQQAKRPVTFKELFRLGFVTTNFQLVLLTVYIFLVFEPFLGFLVACVVIGAIVLFLFLRRGLKKRGNDEKDETRARKEKPPRGFLRE